MTPTADLRITLRVTAAELAQVRASAAVSAVDVPTYVRAALGLKSVQRGGARPGSGRKRKIRT